MSDSVKETDPENCVINSSAEKSHEVEENLEKIDYEESEISSRKRVPNGGWGWMVAFSSFVMHMCVGGFHRSYSVVYLKVLERFNTTAAFGSLIGGIAVAIRMAFSPIGTSLSDRFGCKKTVFFGAFLMGIGLIASSFAPNVYLFLFLYAVVGGLGGALVYAPTIVMVGQYFDKKRSIAMGISTSGSGVGAFIFPPAIAFCFENFGFSGAMMIEGAFLLHMMCGGLLQRPLYQNKGFRHLRAKVKQTQQKGSLYRSLCLPFKNKAFVLFASSMTFSVMCFVPLQNFLPAIAIENGVPEIKAIFLTSIVGICDTISRFLSGFVFDSKLFKPHRSYLFLFAISMLIVSAVALAFITTYPLFAFFAAFHGFMNGVYVAQRSVACADIVGIDNLSGSFGLTIFMQGAGLTVSPYVAGMIKDMTGSYTHSYLFCSVMGAMACLCYGMSICMSMKQKRKYKEEEMTIKIQN